MSTEQAAAAAAITYTLVPDCEMFVVYDAAGNRRGAFDSEWDAEAFMAVLPTAFIEPREQ